ncbi:hypothetical protein F4X33_00645 [Candidatus Poribacteria bacterium]|nr:hypothetical protein [Candidatus Poribacteria bacterium]
MLTNDLRTELLGNRGLVSRARKEFIPTGEQLANQTWDQVFKDTDLTVDDVVLNFNNYLCKLVDTEYQLYLGYEEQCMTQGVSKLVLDPEVGADFPNVRNLVEDALQILGSTTLNDIEKLAAVWTKMRPLYQRVEQSFAQGRKSRAGGSPQYHLQRLMENAGYADEFETQQVLNGTVDFLFPSRQAWERDWRRCIIVSIKRSLRERYKQVFEELSIAQGTVYLFATETYEEAEKDITKSKVERLNEQNVYLVVRDRIKDTCFSEDVNVIGFTAFIGEELPNHRARWANLLRA